MIEVLAFDGSDPSSAALLAEAYTVRMEVFVVEQRVPEELEIDDHDLTCRHFLATSDGVTAGTARLLPPPKGGGYAHLGRLAVLPEYRGLHIGERLVRAVEAAAVLAGYETLELDAQLQAMGFYERLGYAAHGPVFDDAGIPHRAMTRALADA